MNGECFQAVGRRFDRLEALSCQQRRCFHIQVFQVVQSFEQFHKRRIVEARYESKFKTFQGLDTVDGSYASNRNGGIRNNKHLQRLQTTLADRSTDARSGNPDAAQIEFLQPRHFCECRKPLVRHTGTLVQLQHLESTGFADGIQAAIGETRHPVQDQHFDCRQLPDCSEFRFAEFAANKFQSL